MRRIFIIIFLILVGLVFPQKKKGTKISQPPAKPIKLEIESIINGDSTFTFSPLFHDDKVILFEKLSTIRCKDLKDNVVWYTEISSEIAYQPIAADNAIVIITTSNDLILLDISTGKQIQSLGIDEDISGEVIKFNYSGKTELMMPKATNSKTALLLPGESGRILCLDLETLQEHWRNNDLKSVVLSKPILVKEKIITSGKDGFIVCLDSRSGLLIWRWKESEKSDFSKSNFLSDGRNIYFTSSDSTLYSLDMLLGKLNWKLTRKKILNSFILSEDNKFIIAFSNDGRMLFLAAKDGKQVREVKLKGIEPGSLLMPVEIQKQFMVITKSKILLLEDKEKTTSLLSFSHEEIVSFNKHRKDFFSVTTKGGRIIFLNLR